MTPKSNGTKVEIYIKRIKYELARKRNDLHDLKN